MREGYLAVHERKEELFWQVKMGLRTDADRARAELAEAEKNWHAWLHDPRRLDALLALRGEVRNETERVELEGWIAMLSAHVVPDPAARSLAAEIVELEAHIEAERASMTLGWVDPATGRLHPASSVELALMLRTEPDEARRRAAFEGLRSIEAHVLAHGFCDLVRSRNRLARMLGHEDYYAWRVHVVERTTKQRVFEWLDALAERTAEAARAELGRFALRHGAGALRPWNLLYLRSGKLEAQLDPYFQLAPALGRWLSSFAGLGIRFRGATITVDLVHRPGKYENGFMHGPGLAFFERGQWRPARINFSANAILGRKGAGRRTTETLFHEGGHAAHFSNVLGTAPCFSQEFAPTSVAWAETQSMFMDSLVEDPDWQRRHATDDAGNPIPFDLVEAQIVERQPLRAWDLRALMTVPLAERAIYEIADEALEPEVVLRTVRDVEQRLQGLPEGGVRPVLAVPHLLSAEASAYYHGYVLAQMAVAQLRAFFLRRDGHLLDNPRIGPELAARGWAPGNTITFEQAVRAVTGEAPSVDALVQACCRSVSAALAEARERIEAMVRIPRAEPTDELDLTLIVAHGNETIARSDADGLRGCVERFARWAAAADFEARRSTVP